MRILIAKHNATDFTSLSIPSPNGRGAGGRGAAQGQSSWA
ncbi:hypothetical protein T4C_11943 [Trichinella pseudospiralis]|uniref:Uncharacterized protein n=1 Tax=Trichinella pseudospiralis TaxID=6337 RepID=A0A0V1G7Y8_TRIPS|nr:hypothetical protein T4C_11943 [Trichinella pseudospiralis]